VLSGCQVVWLSLLLVVGSAVVVADQDRHLLAIRRELVLEVARSRPDRVGSMWSRRDEANDRRPVAVHRELDVHVTQLDGVE
jgi:hypothetical protein